MKLTSQEITDMDRFTRFLFLKSAQVIIDSRLGHKTTTECNKSDSDVYGFNVAVPKLPEVLEETQRLLKKDVVKGPLCVEISLRTVEGDEMMLESWCLGMLHDQRTEYAVHPFTQTVYNRMGVLLKSLVSVTRVTPAYKMSRRQSSDSYIILYRIYIGQPQLHALGEGYKTLRIGQLCTPVGTVHITLQYRTKMTITPTRDKNNSIMLKSDHFTTNCDSNKDQTTKVDFELGKGMKVGAFAVAKEIEPEPEILLPAPFANSNSDHKENTNVDEEDKSTCNHNGVKLEDRNGNSTPESQSANITMISTADDFIMVDLKMPFAKNRNDTSLGMSPKEWEKAPSLQTFRDIPTFNQQVPDLTQQLQTFEAEISKYDDMVLSLCQSPNNN